MSFGVPPLTRGVKVLMIATLVISVLSAVARPIVEYLAVAPALFWRGMVWTPLTYTFVMPEPMSLIFGLLSLWFIGSMLESRWGTRRFVTFYFLTSAIAALVTVGLARLSAPIMGATYVGNWSAIEGLVAATAILMPTATFFLYFFPVQARMMLPISAGITLLFMLMSSWVAYLPQLFGLAAGVALAGFRPENALLRARVWMIDRKLKRSKLRVVRGKDDDEDPFGGAGRGSDGFLH